MNSHKNGYLKRMILIFLFISSFYNMGIAQHDRHLDAVIEIANGQLDEAKQRIEQIAENPDALWESRTTGAYARAGRTLKKEGEEYRRFVIPENYFVMSMLASVKGNAGAAFEYAKDAVDEGLPFERLIAGPRDAFATLHQSDTFKKWAKKESKLLIHGPMLGNVSSSGASFWVRTANEAEVKIKVKPKSYPSLENNIFEVSRKSARNDYTTVVHIDGLQSNTTYNYSLEVDGENIFVEDATFKTYPKQGNPDKFSIAFGGWTTIKMNDPLALLLLGDNVYIDDPEHLMTNRYCYYRRHSRPEWKKLIAGRGVYSIWDDHDFGTDDSYGGPEIDEPS